MMTRRDSLAWAAGFFDGEGHTRCDDRSASVSLCVGQSYDPVLLHRLVGIFGGSVYGPQPAKGNVGPQWDWKLGTFERTQAAIAAMWPFLGEPKREQALAALVKAAEMRKSRPRGNVISCAHGHPRSLSYRRPRDGAMVCRPCQSAAARRNYLRKKPNATSVPSRGNRYGALRELIETTEQ